MAPFNLTLSDCAGQLMGWLPLPHSSWPLLEFRIIALIVIGAACLRAYIVIVHQPLAVIARLRNGGIRGPPYSLLIGNKTEIDESTRIAEQGGRHLTNLDEWKKQYGPLFYFALNRDIFLVPTSPSLMREILHGTTGNAGLYRKDPADAEALEPLLGSDGLLFAANERWARHRKVLNPEFHVGKLKEMESAMVKHTQQMLARWGMLVAGGGGRVEIEAHEDIYMLTCDTICETLFGYEDGAQKAYRGAGNLYKDIWRLVQDCVVRDFGPEVPNELLRLIPGYKRLPLPINRRISCLRLRLRAMVASLIDARRAKALTTAKATGQPPHYGDDILGGLLVASDEKGVLSPEELMSECMTLFFGGHDSGAHSMTWALLLLAQHPEWQEKARAEARMVLGDGLPTKESVSQLKVITMVFRETLRLFPPVPFVGRTATKDHQLAGLHVPKDQRFFMPILTLHMDPESWGEDAENFKPARFENGLAAASKDPHAYMPFASGPRSCLGQLYAMQQAKIVLAMIVREFKFSVAPGYRHWPDMTLTLRPMLGVQLLVERA